MSKLHEHIGLLILLAAFLVLGTLYLWVTPLLETSDEPSHFSVVKFIADEGRLPPAQPPLSDAEPVPVIRPGPPVYYAPPLYYALGALLIADLNTDGFAQGVIPNPNWARGWAPTAGRSLDNKHIYVLTADQRPPYAGWAIAMLRLRFFSLLLGGATVVGVYALARSVWSPPTALGGRGAEQTWVLAATALVAFNPAFVFVTIGVTNDALLIALSTWAFGLMVRLGVRGRQGGSATKSWGLVALLGVVLGLAALTKQSALLFLPLAAVIVAWSARNTRPAGQPQSWRTALRWLVLLVIPVALLAGWWYLRNAVAYGDPLGFQPHQTPVGEWQPSLSLIGRQLGQALRGYWATFGWGLILVEPIIYVSIAIFALVSLLGLVKHCAARWLRRRPNTECRAAILLGLGLFLNLAGLVLWLWRTSAPYGRLLYPTLGPTAVLLVLGWKGWLGHRFRRLFLWAVVLSLALYAFIVPWRYLRPAYADPVVSPSALEEATPLYVQFDETLHLLGYRMIPESARPGEWVTLILYWRATAPLETPLTVFVQVAPKDPEQRVAGLDDTLGSSHYPSQVWLPGETIRQVHELRLPDKVPAPILYWFNVGLYQNSEDMRLPVVVDGASVPSRSVRLGPLRVLDTHSPQPDQLVDYRLGPAVRLIGYDVDVAPSRSSKASQEDTLTVTLYWRAVAAPEDDLKVFVHLVDADGRLVAQDDDWPRQGEFPTWAWQEGDDVPDSHTLLVPADLPSDTYRILVGLYRPDDGGRLPVLDEEGQRVHDDIVTLTKIHLPVEDNEAGP
jgi:4-amino-4-deoxy-L-arabinose transferase-like glycosyltransferase